MTESETKARTMLAAGPMTRYALQCELGLSQQHTALVIKAVGAIVIGHGRPPLYALNPEPAFKAAPIGRVSSVWDLGIVS